MIKIIRDMKSLQVCSKMESSRDEQIEMELATTWGRVFTSVYELKSIEFAEKMGTVGYKIAAFEMKNKPLLKRFLTPINQL